MIGGASRTPRGLTSSESIVVLLVRRSRRSRNGSSSSISIIIIIIIIFSSKSRRQALWFEDHKSDRGSIFGKCENSKSPCLLADFSTFGGATCMGEDEEGWGRGLCRGQRGQEGMRR